MPQPKFLIALALAALASAPLHALVKPHPLFSDHMVLQAGRPVTLWGKADPGESVEVRLPGQMLRVAAGPDGVWRVITQPLSKGGPHTITFAGSATPEPITVSDVLIGEVWVCSGQSNMDMRVGGGVPGTPGYWWGVDNQEKEIAEATHPGIRAFMLETKMADKPEAEPVGKWVVCSPETVGNLSATSYFFARELVRNGHPSVGLIVTSFGASTAEAWISRSVLSSDPKLREFVNKYDALCAAFDSEEGQAAYAKKLADWKVASEAAKAAGKREPRKPTNPHQDQHNASVLFNGMISPILPFTCRGALWYQGESNGPSADQYMELMQALIHNWRYSWDQGDFPFLFVQLANYKPLAAEPNPRGQMVRVRDAQRRTLAVPNTGMAVAIDIGDANNIHPKNKQEVGRRLGLVARATVYGEKIPYSGPLFNDASVEGSKVRVRFNHAEGLAPASGDKVLGFSVSGADGKAVWADAQIDGDSVLVSAASVPEPKQVHYGAADNPPVNLVNAAGLPAATFLAEVEAAKK